MDVLIVTGSSRGIGAEICRAAAVKGLAVCVNYATSTGEADLVVKNIEQAGGRAISVAADVSIESDVAALFERVDAELGPVTGLVNNAGINGGGTRVDELDVGSSAPYFRSQHTGLISLRQVCHPPHGQTAWWCRVAAIVNISSAASKHGGPGTYIDYAASKGAIDTFTVGLAKEQAPEGIRVNCLRPGATMTELSVEWAKQNPEWLNGVMEQVPLGRPGEVREIAAAALFLLSDEASYITGAILDASGGWVSP